MDLLHNAEQPAGAAALLRTTAEIRRRARALLARARRGESKWFRVADANALEDAAREVAEVTRNRYGWQPIPYHSRWRHFEAGGIDRLGELNRRLADQSAHARAKAHIDLVLVSVLLDAGAGPTWKYHEAGSGQVFARSEGLGVASYHAFMAGLFSSDPQRPLQADAAGLRGLVSARLAQAFQVSENNPLVGMAGRTGLLRRLGEVMAEQPEVFGVEQQRPGGLFDALVSPDGVEVPPTATVRAHEILTQLLQSLSAIWPAANRIDSLAADGSDLLPGPADPALLLGDCWRHSAVEGPGLSNGWMPFHKLSQWLSYSLIEPFEAGGAKVEGLDQLTALPEYRNGGLLLDAGVLLPTDPALLQRQWHAGDEFIVEWRALTVALLDELAPLVRHKLGASEAELPLACVLEGGTWAAGRVLAERARKGGGPPLQIVSDGTVF
ncbi:URC4/urg3 family protein [Xenophilus arseniciresistens]|uniref:URC4/urg3 family protein n=1 Tax=Xenophilus arseniciresistens TaxID=1283306 RepID=A0AAE3N8N0_9BURK|nr:URC4/urg3 family protein [Xenophilus arseniciresistens]MDA7417990.1 URC4/urg3 family protein [Xenophilus arseniciresistens]